MTTKKTDKEEEVPTVDEDEEIEETVIVPSFGNIPGPGDGTRGGTPDIFLAADDTNPEED